MNAEEVAGRMEFGGTPAEWNSGRRGVPPQGRPAPTGGEGACRRGGTPAEWNSGRRGVPPQGRPAPTGGEE